MTAPTHLTDDGEAGFTLLELLIAMTLLGLLSVLMFSSLSFGTRVWERSQSASTGINKIRIVQETLRGELSRLYPAALGTAGDSHIDFVGRANSLSYLVSDGDLPGAFRRVTLQADRNGTQALTSRSVLELGAQTNLSSKLKILLSGVENVEFSYFGPGPDADKTAQWWDSWQNRNIPPSLIRMRVNFAAAGAAQWPDLIVAPRIVTDVNCIYDPLAKNCQGRS